MQRTDRRPPALAALTAALARFNRDAISRRDFLRRFGLGGLGALAGGGVLLGGAGVAYTTAHRNEVFGGVRMAGVDLSELDRETAIARLTAAFAIYSEQLVPVGATPDATRWQVTPAALGATVDYDAAVTAAFAVGRTGATLQEIGDWLGARLMGTSLPLPITLDGARLDALLRSWAPEVTALPTDATFAADGGGGLTIVPDQDGRGIAPDASAARFRDRLAQLSTAPVELSLVPVTAGITAADLRAVRDAASAAVGQPLTLRFADKNWTLGTAALGAALRYRREGDRLVLGLQPEPLRAFFDEVGGAIATPPIDATIVQGANGLYTIVAASDGTILDEAGTLAAIEAALRGGAHEATALRIPRGAAITAEDLKPAFARLDALLNTPLVVSFQEYSRTYTRADIEPLLIITTQASAPDHVVFSLDGAKLGALVQDLAKVLDQDPRDAKFRWLDGAVQDVAGGQDGRTVQIDPTVAAIRTAILGATGKATIAATVTKAKVPTSDKSTIVIRDRLGLGKTPYAGSIPNRKHNVELAVERLNGALIPPDGIFSFNEATGAQTVANGYLQGFGIALVGGTASGEGQYKAVPSIGGGVCQVSTTVFQTVYQAGLPIEERNWHAVWLPSYGPPNSPTGMIGLDATVDDQSGLDLKFQNTSGGWLALEATADGSWVTVVLRGVDPGWTVTNDDPVISNVVPADTKTVYEKTHDLPVGQTITLEEREDGFTALHHTHVTDKTGKVLRDVSFKSNYAPVPLTIQVGVPATQPLT
jgi:vancomycin resistance protein YoaR